MASDSVAVIIPWRYSGDRAPILRWVISRWNDSFPDWTVVLGECPPGEWCKALAVADGLGKVSSDIVIVADADVWTDGVNAAVDAVKSGSPWAVPHLKVYRLDGGSTSRVLDGGVLGGSTVESHVGMIGGGMTVVRRDVYEQCQMDTRFRGWGQEDGAWGLALTCFHGSPWRGVDPLWHLWHERMPSFSRCIGSHESKALLDRYGEAVGSPSMMRVLLDGMREMEDQGICTVYKYRNINDPTMIHELERRNPRLDRLPNWELIEEPAVVVPAQVVVPDVLDMVVTPEPGCLVTDEPAPEPDPVPEIVPDAVSDVPSHTVEPEIVVESSAVEEVESPAVNIDVTVQEAGQGATMIDFPEQPEPEPQPEPVKLPARPLRPRQPDPKQAWETYARAIGVDPTGMTKAQIMARCTGAGLSGSI